IPIAISALSTVDFEIDRCLAIFDLVQHSVMNRCFISAWFSSIFTVALVRLVASRLVEAMLTFDGCDGVRVAVDFGPGFLLGNPNTARYTVVFETPNFS